MMTHEQIKDTIVRLRELGDIGRITSFDIVDAVYDSGNNYKVRDALIAILEQADPDTHMELPRDADGKVIHIGDEVDGVHREDGTVMGIQYYEGVGVLIAVRPRNWDTPSWCDPAEYRHHHKPTVRETLRKFLAESEDAMRKGYDEVPEEIYDEYEKRLRKVIADD
jgi:hypothetical protein